MSEDKQTNRNKDAKFADLSLKGKMGVSIGLSLLIVSSLSVAAALIFFAYNGMFALLGVQFDSWKSILFFILLAILVDIVMGSIRVFLKVAVNMWLPDVSNLQKQVFLVAAHIGLDWLAIHAIDDYMDTITMTMYAELGMAFLVFALDRAFPVKKKR